MIRSAFCALAFFFTLPAAAQEPGKWIAAAKKRLTELDNKYPGQFGVAVRDLRTGETLSYRGEESWYIASGTKVPVALEVLRQVDEGRLTLDSQILVEKEDHVDGAGQTSLQPAGTKLTVRYLIEQMIIHSDNTASDLLIRTCGLEKVNALIKRQVPAGFGPVTALSDVRRHVYSSFHPNAVQLKNRDFIQLKAMANDRERTAFLKKTLGVSPAELKLHSLDEAFSNYYIKGLNSASLEAYTQLLDSLASGRILKPESTKFLLDVMERVQTGDNRIKAAFPRGVVFAHKTGTQHKRVCDFGLIRDESTRKNLATVAACVRGVAKVGDAEEILKSIGKTLPESGLFDTKGEMQ